MSRHELALDGREHAVSLRDGGDHVVEATVTGGGATHALRLTVHDLGGGRWLVRDGDAVHEVRVERRAGDEVRVVSASGAIALERLDPFRDALRAGLKGGGTRKVTAPIPGRVVNVLVAAGDEVTAGQPVVIVEAMKMANELRAPVAGRVTRVEAQVGAAVDAGAVLVVIEG